MTETTERHLVTRWRDLLIRYNEVACALDRALQDEHGIGRSEFEVLDRLIECGEAKARMHDLAGDMYLSQSALSRTVARLERAGLVARTMCHHDRRAIFVAPTDGGRRLHAEACGTHRNVLAAHLGDD